MKVAIIGIRNHAERIARLVSSVEFVTELLLYHPNKEKLVSNLASNEELTLRLSDDFAAVCACDAVIIASPHDSHFNYIKALLESEVYILCEKPPASNIEQLEMLYALSAEQKSRIAFNFNFSFSSFASEARKIIKDGSMGKPLALNFSASHGIAFKESYTNNWRLLERDPFSTILGNLGVHYIHLATDLVGSIIEWNLIKNSAAPNTNGVDTVGLMLRAENNVIIQIFLSYAAPYTSFSQLILTDGLVCMEDGVVSTAGPRDSFGDDGRYKKPPATICSTSTSTLDYYDASMALSISNFINIMRAKGDCSIEDFNKAIAAARLVLEM